MLDEGKKPHCSFCDSTNVQMMSRFGTAQLVRQYYCISCRSVFEFVRWQEEDED
jgi:hypothetical protein